MTVMLALRVVLSLLVGALGVVLLAAGNVVVGGLLVALAVVRLVMTAVVWTRGRRWRSRRQDRATAWRERRGAAGPAW
jgi:hypothetical protein